MSIRPDHDRNVGFGVETQEGEDAKREGEMYVHAVRIVNGWCFFFLYKVDR